MEIAALLLCGGAARRFGADKLLAGPVPLAVRAALNLKAGAGHVLAVIPPERAELRESLAAAGCEILETDRTARGMGASIAAGVEATATRGGWIVALGDMPLVAPETVAAVRAALEAGALIAAPYDGEGRRGHPVGFSMALSAELLALDGDSGARAILDRHESRIVKVRSDDPGIFVDVDTPEDLRRLQ